MSKPIDCTMSRSFGTLEFNRGPNLISSTDQSPYHSTFRNEVNNEEGSEGYDEFFDPPLESKFKCPICLLGLREPVQTSCGHRFCKGCIKRSIRDAGPKCPIDNEPLSENQLYPDNFAKREMMLFTVACRHKKLKGCDWKGPLGDIQEHLKNCPYVDIDCPNECGETIQRKDLDQHNAQQCPKRTVICKYCQGSIVHTLYKSHLSECLKAPALCDLCKTSIAKDEMDDHKIRNCPMVVMTCPSKGCSFEGLQKEVKEHYVTRADHMFDLAITVRQLTEAQSTTFPSTSTEAAAGPQEQQSGDFGLQQTVPELTRNYQTVQRETNELKRMTNDHSNFVTVLEQRQTRHEHETDAKVRRMVDTFERSLHQTQVESRIRQICLETRLDECEGRMCNGTYTWRVENFRQCRQDAINGTQTDIYSPPFFTKMCHGHKMRMKINLNGVDSGVGKYISLFVQMMQGKYDEVATWPFTGLITLSILDQSEDVERRRHFMITFFANRNMLPLQRQKAQRNEQWHGYEEFAAIDTLLNGQYVKKNVLLVEIQIR